VRVLIVDDEMLARSILSEHLQKIPEIEIAGQAANGFEAVKLAEELTPDLIFLDIQMPKLSGFEVLELLGDRAPAVIFTTAYDEYALRAFEVHAVDYLLKPVEDSAAVGAGVVACRTSARTKLGAHSHSARRARPRAADRSHRLHRSAGRLLVVRRGREASAQAADDE
jgi:two-component system LytT family response regulator